MPCRLPPRQRLKILAQLAGEHARAACGMLAGAIRRTIALTRKKIFIGLTGMLVLAGVIANANGQWSPSRPVRMIVPFPPGGAVDTIGRIFATRMPERLGQQLVVDNRGGANAIIGTEITAKAAPDGHTILIV